MTQRFGLIRSATTRWLVVPAAMICAMGLLGEAALAQSKPEIRIATGRQGGAYYSQGALLAEALYRTGKVASATAESSSGAIESARLLDSGKITFGGVDAVWATTAMAGEAPFKKKIALRTISPFGVMPLFFVTKDNSPVRTLADIKGKKIAVGAKGSGMENHLRRVLDSIGWSFKDIDPAYLSFGPGARAVREGKVAAQWQCCVPNRALTELSELEKVRAVAYPSDKLATIVAKTKTYGEMTLKTGAFRGHAKDAKVVRLVTGWMGTKATSSEIAYLVAKTLLDNLDAMAKKMPQYGSVKILLDEAKTKGAKALEVGAPMHPGAAKAFKEAGIL